MWWLQKLWDLFTEIIKLNQATYKIGTAVETISGKFIIKNRRTKKIVRKKCRED